MTTNESLDPDDDPPIPPGLARLSELLTHLEDHFRSAASEAERSSPSTNDLAQRGAPARQRQLFYTVAEAARVLRVDPATIYRAIRADAFPAVRIRSRYVIPVAAVDRMAAAAAESGECVDVADHSGERLTSDPAHILRGLR